MSVNRPDLIEKYPGQFNPDLIYFEGLATPAMAGRLAQRLRTLAASEKLQPGFQLELPSGLKPPLTIVSEPLGVVNYRVHNTMRGSQERSSIFVPSDQLFAVSVESERPSSRFSLRRSSHNTHVSSVRDVALASLGLQRSIKKIEKRADYKVRPVSDDVLRVIEAAAGASAKTA